MLVVPVATPGNLAGLGTVDEQGPPPSGHPVFRPSETWISLQHTGFCLPEAGVFVGGERAAGARIGRILPLWAGGPDVEVLSPHAGRLLFLVTALSTTPGTPRLRRGRSGAGLACVTA